MCGRFKLDVTLDVLEMTLLNTYGIPSFDRQLYEPRQQVKPTEKVLTIIHDGQHNRIGQLKWGFLPFYAQHSKDKPLINARGETLSQKRAFADSFQQRRCIVLADAFYEWKTTPLGKQPMEIGERTRDILPLAGLWNTFIDPHGEKIHTCTVITVKANDLIEPIHARMPLILSDAAINPWLNPPTQNPDTLQALIQTYPDTTLYMKPLEQG